MIRLAKRDCLNCGKPYRPLNTQQAYCTAICMRAARRVRDREAKAGLRALRDPFLATGANGLGPAFIGRCLQCRMRKQLRFDYYDSVTDDMVTANPVFCSADCLAGWWVDDPGPDQASERIRTYIATRKGTRPADDDEQRDPYYEQFDDLGDDDEIAS